jgi:hypothetical protein
VFAVDQFRWMRKYGWVFKKGNDAIPEKSIFLRVRGRHRLGFDGVTFFNRKDVTDCSCNGDHEAGQARPHPRGKRKNHMVRVGCK